MPTTSPIPESLLEDRFPDWWRPLGVDVGGIVEARRNAIVDLANTLETADLVNAVGYAYGDKGAGGALIDRVRQVAREHDEAFAGDVGDAEPSAMVAAAIAHHLAVNPSHDDSTVISMLILSAHWKRLKPTIRGQALEQYAELQLGHAASTARSSARVVISPTALSKVEGAVEGLEELPDGAPQLAAAQVRPHLDAHREALSTLARRVDLIARRVRDEQSLVREELGLQTWLLEEWCEAADVAWGEVEAEAVPILAGVELAARTALPVPFADCSSLLASTISKAGRDATQSSSPYQCITATRAIAEGVLGEATNERLFPLTAAFTELGAEGGGKDRAQRAAGTRKRRILAIAEQAYREALTTRVVSGSNG